MGNELRKETAEQPQCGISTPDLLSLTKIKGHYFNVENLILSGGGPKCFAFAGALKVLEEIGVFQKLMRFTGVGTSAVAAALLAAGYDCKSIQDAYAALLDNLIIDDREGYAYLFPGFVENLGWNNGDLFRKWLNRLLETKTALSDVTFERLYRKTGKDLCIVVTNVNKMCIEYFHAKTTPDILIADAVFTSLSIPGIFYPSEYKFGETRSIYTNGSLLCSYPIHSYDGWWLSMKPKFSIPLKIKKASEFLAIDHAFKPWQPRSLGLLFIDSTMEPDYKVFVKRLTGAGSNIAIPNTVLGNKFKEHLTNRGTAQDKFYRLRMAYFRILDLVKSRDTRPASINSLAKYVFTDPFYEMGEPIPRPHPNNPDIDCVYLMCELATGNKFLRAFTLRKLLRPKTMEAIDNCINTRNLPVNDLHTLFSALSYIAQAASLEVKASDYPRTVGILGGHISSNDINLEHADEEYLYKQSWNATVAYFQERIPAETYRM